MEDSEIASRVLIASTLSFPPLPATLVTNLDALPFESVPPDPVAALSFLKYSPAAPHVIVSSPAKASLLILAGKLAMPREGTDIICISPKLLETPRVAEIYEKRSSSASKALFDEREHSSMFADAFDGFYVTGEDPLLVPTEIPITFYVSAVLRHVSPYPHAALTHQDESEYLPPCPRMSALVVPDDAPELKTAANMLDSMMLRGYISPRGTRIAAEYSLSHLHEAVREFIERSHLMYRLWEVLLPPTFSLQSENVDFEQAYIETGMKSALDAIASGVPLEDVIA